MAACSSPPGAVCQELSQGVWPGDGELTWWQPRAAPTLYSESVLASKSGGGTSALGSAGFDVRLPVSCCAGCTVPVFVVLAIAFPP